MSSCAWGCLGELIRGCGAGDGSVATVNLNMAQTSSILATSERILVKSWIEIFGEVYTCLHYLVVILVPRAEISKMCHFRSLYDISS